MGNGIGSSLLLVSGILIARYLGADLYGEYGVVKSTMFYIASFATLGLGITSTKYIAQYLNVEKKYIKSLINDCLTITIISSITLAFALFVFSSVLANFLDEPTLKTPFRFLSIIIILRAYNVTQIGILGGLKKYKDSALNNCLSGLVMLALCIPLTLYFSLSGALSSLLISQLFFCVINSIYINRLKKNLCDQEYKNFKKELFVYSLPVALQESTYFISSWGGMMILTKFSNLIEVGLYSAASQWNAIILFIPQMLYNVVLSHLSSKIGDITSQKKIIRVMLMTNLISTLIPCIIVGCLSGFIANFYGSSFENLPSVMNVLIFSTVFTCCSNVFRTEFIALGKNWLLLSIRFSKDIIFLLLCYLIIRYNSGNNGAYYYSWCSLITSILYFIILYSGYKLLINNYSKKIS